jgi:transcriptional regulator with XRE-family HTH domain
MRNAAGGTWATLVKRMRATTGMTGAELARRLDVDRATIWRWEAGRQKPESANLIKAFADLFGLDVDDALAAAGLRPSDSEEEPVRPAPMHPSVVKLLAMLADPDTPPAVQAQVRATLEFLDKLADTLPPKKSTPKRQSPRRRGA